MNKVIMNEQRTGKEKLKLYLIGFVVTFYIGMLFGSAYETGCSLGEWINNFNTFVLEQHHFIVGFTGGTFGAILFFEVVWLLIYYYTISKILHPFAGREYGDAKWGDPQKFTNDFGNHEEKYMVRVNFGDCPEPSEPVYVNTHNYWFAEGVYLNIDNKLTSNLNIEVIGPPGTGKSFRLVRPILSQLAGSFLVTDPKGEISQQTGQYMEDNGYGVFVIDAESEAGMLNCHHFNPFVYLETESDILSLCEILFKATKNKDASGGEQFFEDMAQILMTAIFYLIHYTYPKSKQNWKSFVELLNSDTVKANPQTGAIDTSDPDCLMQRFIRANNRWKEEHDGEELKGYKDVEKIYTNAQETASSIISSLDAHCKYMKLDCVVNLLSTDDLDITNTFGYGKKTKKSPTGKYVLYIVTSENVHYFDWIPSMIYSLFIEKLYSLTKNDPALHQTLPNHLTLLMDEFANVVLPDSFVGLTSTMRSRGISVIMIIQNLMQLKACFPQNDQDKNLRSNMSTTILLGGPKSTDDCKTLSEEFGHQTIHKQTTGLSKGNSSSSSENEDVMDHNLFPAQDIANMAKDGPCAIHVSGTDPLWVDKVQFQNSPLLPLLTRKNPYKIKTFKLYDETKFDENKEPFEQMPDILFGAEAEEALKECEENGINVLTLHESDLQAISVLLSHNEEITGENPDTEEFWRVIHDNSKRVLEEEKRNAINFDGLGDEQILIVQRLKNNGFSVHQIDSLTGLIRSGLGYDDIVKYFNPGMADAEIDIFAARLADIKNQKVGGN